MIARLASGALAIGLACAALAGPALAADPTPSPIVFGTPQLLVWWEGHSTYNGPVSDEVYALILPSQVDPADDTHFIVVDSYGDTYHYTGHLVSGPYKGQADLCPVMLALGIDYLTAYPYSTAVGFSADDCRAMGAQPSPTGHGGPALPGGSGQPGGSGPLAGVDPVALDIAAAIIAILLGIGTLAGVRHVVRRARRPKGPKPDPCAAEVAALQLASAHARGLNSVLFTLREFYAALEQQIVMIEKAEIPATLGVDIAFLAGGQIGGKLGPGWIPDTILGKMIESIVKDQTKGVIKKILGSGAFGAWGKGISGAKAGESAAKAMLKALLKDRLADHYVQAGMQGVSVSPFYLQGKLRVTWAAADKVAGSMADAMGNLLSFFSTSNSLLDLVHKSAEMREKAMDVYGNIAELQEQLNSAIEAERFAADRLNHCRTINAPGWRP